MLGLSRISLSALLTIAAAAPLAVAQNARNVSLDRGATDPVVVERGDFDGDSKNWLRDLAFTIRNVHSKPVYAAEFDLIVPSGRSGVKGLVLVMRYGKEEFVKANFASSKDKALNPKKTTSIKLSSDELERVYDYVKSNGVPYPSSVTIRLKTVYFGDGTAWQKGRPVTLGGSAQVASRSE